MKAYKEYMDNITVSDVLHRKLVSYSTSAKTVRCPITVRRYVAVFACLAVIMLGALTVPQLLQESTAPERIDKSTYTLIFNKAINQASSDIGIPGHFWHELNPAELQAVFPGLAEMHTITATANYRGDGTLFNIDAHALSVDGYRAYIQAAPGEVTLDYVLDGKVNISNVLGTAVKAGYFETKPNSRGKRNVIYFASFKLSNLDYYVELGGVEEEKEGLKEEISTIIGLLIKGGAADLGVLHPIIPELREDKLNMEGARSDSDFGAYLPKNLPSGFIFESAMRFINQEHNYLSATWTKDMGYIEWRVSALGKDDEARITSIADTQNYDLSLYPIPRADSVPDVLREIVDNPIFRSEDLTLKTIQARAYEVSDSGDESGSRMKFGVLYGGTLIELNVKGSTPEAVFDMLQQIKP